MTSVFKAVDLVPLCELAIELMPVAVVECGKLRSFKAVCHVKDILKPGIDEVLGSQATSCAIAAYDQKIIGLLIRLAELL